MNNTPHIVATLQTAIETPLRLTQCSQCPREVLTRNSLEPGVSHHHVPAERQAQQADQVVHAGLHNHAKVIATTTPRSRGGLKQEGWQQGL